jgi:creatinine amidohydrolase
MPVPRKQQNELSVQWEELTAPDFPKAVLKARRLCLLPIGVIEKHGPHLPLGTDVMAAREVAVSAAQREYAVVFPHYYFGQIYEARHQPGCVAIRPDLLSLVLQNVCDEIHRNGFDKILVVNGHGGNTHWLNFFCQAQLAERRAYAIYVARRPAYEAIARKVQAMRKTDWGGHADEVESSWMAAIRPDLVRLDWAGRESGKPQGRLAAADDAFTGISWYADFPNHYAGDARPANAELGRLALEAWVAGLTGVISSVKRDRAARKLQDDFYSRAEAPISTKPSRRPSARRRES